MASVNLKKESSKHTYGERMATTHIIESVNCPHCWEKFNPADVVWISANSLLLGDFRLGEMAQERFLPTRFNAAGQAIDRKGGVCKAIACPHCHLPIPFSLLEMQPFFISIVGAPASGKSYFLASMTRSLSQTLPQKFGVNIMDADAKMNQQLRDYESAQFLNDDENALVKIEKTQEQGDLYNTVQIDDEQVTYPQPFILNLEPLGNHPYASERTEISRAICLYDNAGESYLPVADADRSTLPVTRHLGQSNAIFFLYDPLQDNRCRSKCRKVSNDPQLRDDVSGAFRKSVVRQESILSEMINRTRNCRHMKMSDKYPNPIIVIVTKCDAWKNLIPDFDLSSPWQFNSGSSTARLDMGKIRNISDKLRQFLLGVVPEIVGTVEPFASDVIYIPVSATGISPILDESTMESGFRSKDVSPVWAEIPMLYALARTKQKVIPTI